MLQLSLEFVIGFCSTLVDGILLTVAKMSHYQTVHTAGPPAAGRDCFSIFQLCVIECDVMLQCTFWHAFKSANNDSNPASKYCVPAQAVSHGCTSLSHLEHNLTVSRWPRLLQWTPGFAAISSHASCNCNTRCLHTSQKVHWHSWCMQTVELPSATRRTCLHLNGLLDGWITTQCCSSTPVEVFASHRCLRVVMCCRSAHRSRKHTAMSSRA